MKMLLQSYTRNFWVGLIGFILGGTIGALATYIIFTTGVMSIVVNFVSSEQPFVRYLFGIVLAFIGIGFGGAIDGLVCGYTLHLVDREGRRGRYLLGGAFSAGISQGILVIPILLFISLVSIYNVGSQNDPASFISLFALIGGLFGVLNGAILSFATLRIRYAWIAWLGYFIASLLGGALFGLLIWRPGWISSAVTKGTAVPLYLILAGATIYGLAGGVLGLIYTWLSHKRRPGTPAIEPKRWQDIITITVAMLIFLGDVSLINHLAKFVTIYPGNLTTSLSSKTEGIHWQESQIISSDLPLQGGTTVGIAISVDDPVTVWSNGIGEILISFQHSRVDGLNVWSRPINVSKSPTNISVHPQVILGNDGTSHVVWSENGDIWYNQCENATCDDPIILSKRNQFCSSEIRGTNSDWPVIALSKDDTLMAAWQVGDGFIGYTSWKTTIDPDKREVNCFPSNLISPYPRLAASEQGEFWMILSGSPDSTGPISVVNFQQRKWNNIQTVGEGSSAEIFVNQAGDLFASWCGSDKKVHFLVYGSYAEVVNSSRCQNRPSIFTDGNGRMHLFYIADQWEDNFGNNRIGNSLMETIQQSAGWTEPAIVMLLSENAQQEIVGSVGGNVHLAWVDKPDVQQVLWHSTLRTYQCDESLLSGIMQVVISAVRNGNYHPKDYQPPYCGNHFEELIFLPKPSSEYAVLPPGEMDGFDQTADLITHAQYEVLFSIMQWDTDKNNLSPGSRIAKSISDLYQQVKTNPEAYPRGLTIKILLGNYPNLSTLQMGDQIWNVIQDLADMGVETLEDPIIGWKVEVANYKGTFPHSHTKFIVVDGKTLMAAGFNISWDHLPKDHPSKKGIDMADLGIVLTGPVAQTGITVFDEMWQGANQLTCKDLIDGNLKYLKKICTWEVASVSHQAETLKFFLPGDTANAIALYRTADYKESDDAYHAALASAQESIDAIQANFTAELICDVNMIFPSVCNFNNSLPYMQSLVDAIEKNRAHVRVLVEKENMNGLENQVGIQILEAELANRGLLEYIEIRYFNGRVHTKAVMIDDRLLIIGSQNFHYSSISEGGLNEFNLVTDAPEALSIYKNMFEYFWQQGIPVTRLK